jgi:hypothetical protein
VIVALPLICNSSYRGVIEFLRDLLGIPVSLRAVHDVLARQRTLSMKAKTCRAPAWVCKTKS